MGTQKKSAPRKQLEHISHAIGRKVSGVSSGVNHGHGDCFLLAFNDGSFIVIEARCVLGRPRIEVSNRGPAPYEQIDLGWLTPEEFNELLAQEKADKDAEFEKAITGRIAGSPKRKGNRSK